MGIWRVGFKEGRFAMAGCAQHRAAGRKRECGSEGFGKVNETWRELKVPGCTVTRSEGVASPLSSHLRGSGHPHPTHRLILCQEGPQLGRRRDGSVKLPAAPGAQLYSQAVFHSIHSPGDPGYGNGHLSSHPPKTPRTGNGAGGIAM